MILGYKDFSTTVVVDRDYTKRSRRCNDRNLTKQSMNAVVRGDPGTVS